MKIRRAILVFLGHVIFLPTTLTALVYFATAILVYGVFGIATPKQVIGAMCEYFKSIHNKVLYFAETGEFENSQETES